MKTFKEFLEGKGNPRPSPQRSVNVSHQIATKPAMPARTTNMWEPVRFTPKKQRVQGQLGLVPHPYNTIPGTISRPSDK